MTKSARTTREARLTEKQRRFVEFYIGDAEGNATKAARLAGYSGDGRTLAVKGAEAVRNDKVSAAIEAARRAMTKAAIATREERQGFLTRLMRDEKIEPKDRLKACEVLGKMQGDFVEKHEVAMQTKIVRVVMPDNGRGPSPRRVAG